ncbi:MAG: AMP-binding protein [Phycisphaerales bacterium]|nr:AMP-binding protein [Phycisphaerales bacterium]
MRLVRTIMRNWIRHPFQVSVIDDRKRWRGIALWVATRHIARVIREHSDQPRIGVMLPTSGATMATCAAGWMLGRTVVPLNYLLAREELEYVIEHAGLDAVVTAGPMLERFGEMPEGVQAIKLEEQKFKGLPPMMPIAKCDDDHVAVILYTSGTSGRPKGVMLTTANLMANVQQVCDWVEFTRRDCFVSALPQFHSFGFTVMTVLPAMIGCRAVYSARFNAPRILELMRTHRPTAFMAIPSMYAALLHAKSATPDHFSSLRFMVSGGEPLPDAVYEGYKARLGVTLCEGFGLTETSPVTHWCRPHEERRGSIGKPLGGVEQRIVDEQGNDLPAGTDGELLLRGPNIMAGYYRDEEATAAALSEAGWFRTGDMARQDEEGYTSITGRIKEMLIIGGENVFPREIEEVLVRHPSVAMAAVIGVPDPSRGEVALGFVECVPGETVEPSALRTFCRDALAGYKVPREIRVLEELPKGATGKVLRRALSADTGSADPEMVQEQAK